MHGKAQRAKSDIFLCCIMNDAYLFLPLLAGVGGSRKGFPADFTFLVGCCACVSSMRSTEKAEGTELLKQEVGDYNSRTLYTVTDNLEKEAQAN